MAYQCVRSERVSDGCRKAERSRSCALCGALLRRGADHTGRTEPVKAPDAGSFEKGGAE